ncbi:MAG TPA: PilC/PilY family type IV pilus protein [Burkholderiales bacterium]|nr:PilC/PilY family type IV pilus protein [Burkholderiales bacterium]
MNALRPFTKIVVWMLIAALINPVAVAPTFARDTDIYLSVTTGNTTAEPNVLFILGTNDRMNIPEPWHEYPGAYDSHIEYLWNDINIISNSEVTAESASAISDTAAPVNPYSPWGTWDGTALTDRQNLWKAVKLYANATDIEGGVSDPGPRYMFRNYYNDESWLYWLPTGTATSDPRLMSPSFNRFRAGSVNYVSSTRGGITYPPTGPTSPYNYSTVNNYASFNLCSSLTPQLTPSTVMAPSTVAQNNGYVLNQQWIRYEPYLNLATIGVGSYPGSSTNYNSYGYAQGYLDGSLVPPTNGFPVPAAGVTLPSYLGAPYRDNVGGSPTGSQGQPIRVQQSSTTSYAGWANPQADLGGYTYQSIINGYPYSYNLTGSTSGSYAVLQTVLGWYGITSQIGSAWNFTAWKGNRDASSAFGMATGTPAYYDTTAACNSSTGPAATSTCVAISQGAVSAQNATWTQQCKYTAGWSERDAQSTLRVGGGNCSTNGSPSCSDPRTVALGYSAPHLACGDFSPPASCGTPVTQTSFLTQYINTNCSASSQSTITVGSCAWSGRSSVNIEGQGYFYYGGTCTESGSTASCSTAATTNPKTLNGVSQSFVMGPYTPAQFAAGTFASAGCTNSISAGNYTYGGTCSGGLKYNVATTYTAGTRPNAPTAAPNPNTTRTTTNPLTTCAFSGGTSLTIRGNSQTYNRSCATTESNTDQTCATRYGVACDNSTTITTGVNTAVCPNQTTTIVAIPGVSASTYYYQAYKQNATQANLYHECLNDGPSFNPGANSYPTSVNRTFATAANTSTTATPNTALTQAYTTSANTSYRVAADSTKNIDVYSVNYLNWLFGAKACRDTSGALIISGTISSSATCSPIGRKTRLQVAKDALSTLVSTTDGIRAGLEVFNKTDTTLASEGGNIAYAIHRMGSNSTDTPYYGNRTTLVNAIQGVVASSRTPLTESLYEAYRYFSGRTPVFGTLTTTAQSGGTVSAGYDTSVGTNSDSTPNTIYLRNSGGTYNSPMMNNPNVAGPAGCQKNFIVLITNGQPEDDFSANAAIKTMRWHNVALNKYVSPRTDLDSNWPNGTSYNQIPAVAGGNPYGPVDLASTANDGGYIWLDELSYFLSYADVSPGAQNYVGESITDLLPGQQTINTYTIGFAGVSSPVVQDAAQQANGNFYIAQNAAQLSQALTAVLNAIRNWNPTGTGFAVPLDTLNRGQSSNDIFISFFGPSPNDTWQGTVKKFEIGVGDAQCGTGVTVCLIGQTVLATGNYNINDIDPLTGQSVIDPTSTSFWGPSNLQDGSSPNKGGTGYQLINNTPSYTPSTRKVYTFLSNGVSTTTDLTDSGNLVQPGNTAITGAMLGTGSAATRETLINYILGGSTTDPNCTDGDASTLCTTWASWPHFDVQHAAPAIVTYDSTQDPPIQYVYYVQDNGMVTAADANTGQEKWSFLIEEALPQLSALQANLQGPEIYVADGNPAVFFDDQNNNGIIDGSDRVWLFFGLRRGGRVLYALDITNKDRPLFKWKITANSGSGMVCLGHAACTPNAQFNELGQTWSTPMVGTIRNLGAATGHIPALIFAGGYDPLEDVMPWVGDPVTHKDTMGRAVYVINADTANIINSWGVGQSGSYRTGNTITTSAIPSDVAALNMDGDAQGYLDRIYVGDLGGNVWRFDIDDSSPSNWRGEQLATLSDATGEKRKFFYAPAVAPSYRPFRFDAVYVGSGDKEHPLCTSSGSNNPCPAYAASDKVFMLMDDPSLNSGGGTPTPAGPSALSTPITQSTLVNLSDTNVNGATDTTLTGSQGWKRSLDNGEKVSTQPTVFFNELRFGTYAPLAQNNSCTPPGQGRVNQINSLYGSLEALNGSSISASSRYYADFLARGYISIGSTIVVNTGGAGTTVGVVGGTNSEQNQGAGFRAIFLPIISESGTKFIQIGTIGGATKIYWYLEPEQ